MQFNLDEFNTILLYLENIDSSKGIVKTSNHSILVFDKENKVEISYKYDKFEIYLNGNIIHKSKYNYKLKNDDINKLISKRYNQIIEMKERGLI